MTLLGYIRVSTKEQNPDRQKQKLKALGVDERFIFEDKASGKDFNRYNYQLMRNQIIRAGDLIYIDSLDRFGRSYDEIIAEWKYITRELNADIVVLDQQELFDSRKFKQHGEIGKLLEDQMLSLLAYVAETERTKIKNRQKEGISIARANGKKLGRPPIIMTPELKIIFKKWEQHKLTIPAMKKITGLGKTTLYKIIKEYNYSKVNI